MISIGTDIGALVLQNTLEQNTIGLNNSIERMTTGYKINHAKDDAAGFSIASSLSSKISSMITVQQNVEDGLALLKTAEGSLDNIMSLLQRLRDLAEQASNEIYGDDSRNALQAEADEIIAQIEQIKNTTEFNGINLFEANNSTGGTVTTSISPTRSRIGISNSQVQIKNDSISTNVLDEQSDSISSKQTSFTSVLASVDDEIKELSSSITANASPNILATTTAAPLSADISGAEDFAGNETKVITIDGVQYTIKNRLSTSQSISYTKDTTTGEVMFIGNRFEIRGQSDVAHNIIINGKNNYVYGGDLDDKIVAKLGGNLIYAGAGNDILIADSAGVQIYGQDGDDIITLNSGLTVSGISGGNGNDTFNLNGKQWINSYITGDAGNDVFNIINGSSWKLSGGEGDDEFNIQAGSNNLINGNGGVNTVIQDKGTGTTTVNVVGANSYLEDINANETKTLTINGINYNITNNASAQNSIIYSIASNGQITFKTSIINTAGIVIRGEENKSHNVRIYSERITFYGGNLNDVITVSSSNVNVYGLGGDDVITNSGTGCNLYGGTGNDNITSGYKQNFVFGEEGDDTIKITGRYTSVNAGEGNDNVTVTGQHNIIYGGEGTNTISNNQSTTQIAGFGSSDNATAEIFSASQTKKITINGIVYTVKNTSSEENVFLYSYNPVNNEVSLGGRGFTITGQSDVAHNVNCYGSINFTGGSKNDVINIYSTDSFSGGDGDDIITNYAADALPALYGGNGNDIITLASGSSTNSVSGGAGDDTININSSSSNINGGVGNDIYNINAACSPTDDGGNNIYNINCNGANITGSNGNDTFYVKGNNNTVSGRAGDDYFVIDGVGNNLIDGATGDNFYVDNSGGTASIINVTNDPNSGILNFTYVGEEKFFIIDGKKYVIKNTTTLSSPVASNSLKYSYNPQTGEITVTGSNFTITTDTAMNLLVRGDNNIIDGSQENDKITIESGTNNQVNGNEGNDILISNSTNNSLLGGKGNDTITLNATTNKEINGGEDDDIININSNNNTNIQTGIGNDQVSGTGSWNTIDLSSGNNNLLLNGSNNTITGGDGNNLISAIGDGNTITSGDGDNVIGVDGTGNNISSGIGNSKFNIYGQNNTAISQNGNNSVLINGSDNIFTSINGKKDVTITGDRNTVSTGAGNDTFEVQGNGNIISSTSGENNIDIIGNTNEYSGGSGVDKIVISGDNNITKGGDSNDNFVIQSGNMNNIDGEAGDKNILRDKGIDTIYKNVLLQVYNPYTLTLKVDEGSGQSNYITTSIGFDIFDFSVDFSTRESALDALDGIDDLISEITSQLSNIGAVINRLDSVYDANTIKINNLLSSLSTIKDADIAEESANFIRYQILQNATSSLITLSRGLRSDAVLGIINNINTR